MRYRTKDMEIEAVQWVGNNQDEIDTLGAKTRYKIETLKEVTNIVGNTEKLQLELFQVYDYLQDTWVTVNPDDFIIKGMKGEFYPCNPEVFNAKYEPV